MANLYITEQNSILRKTGDRLILQKNDKVLLDVQCHKIDAVLLFGNVQFTTQAVMELFDHGIELAILSRNGRLRGQITSPMTKNITLRLAQFDKYRDPVFRLSIAKTFLQGKITNSLSLLRRFAYNHTEIDLNKEIQSVEKAAKEITSADEISRLFGIEGSAANAYFKAMGKMVLKEFSFAKRTKHPPKDPVNALLSLSYTMLFNEISSLLDGLGFDPYLGYFHHPEYGRASLAADLMEEFRAPVADRFTLNLVNKKMVSENSFYNGLAQSIYLKRNDLKKYFAEYEKFINREIEHPLTGKKTTFRQCYRTQAEALAKALTTDDNIYKPFLIKI